MRDTRIRRNLPGLSTSALRLSGALAALSRTRWLAASLSLRWRCLAGRLRRAGRGQAVGRRHEGREAEHPDDGADAQVRGQRRPRRQDHLPGHGRRSRRWSSRARTSRSPTTGRSSRPPTTAGASSRTSTGPTTTRSSTSTTRR